MTVFSPPPFFCIIPLFFVLSHRAPAVVHDVASNYEKIFVVKVSGTAWITGGGVISHGRTQSGFHLKKIVLLGWLKTSAIKLKTSKTTEFCTMFSFKWGAVWLRRLFFGRTLIIRRLHLRGNFKDPLIKKGFLLIMKALFKNNADKKLRNGHN